MVYNFCKLEKNFIVVLWLEKVLLGKVSVGDNKPVLL